MREPDLVLTRDDGGVYLKRWWIIPRNRRFNIYLHHFLGSDDDRALHDHPWGFLSIVLRGGYFEVRKGKQTRWRRPGSVAFMPATHAHRVQLDKISWRVKSTDGAHVGKWFSAEKPAWTLIFTGPIVRSWGFWCPQGWISWKQFDKKNGCGER